MSRADWQIIEFSARMAIVSTALILAPGIALGWCLARLQWRGKALAETLVSLPLVMPPVLTGLILLELFGRRGPIGHWLYNQFSVDVVFTWRAVVLALALMSLPLFVWVARSAIEEVNPALEQMAHTLGAGRWRVFFTVTLPLAKRGLVAGMLLAFARALGEFGATITVAGNIPGRTTTLAVSIFDQIQLGHDVHAWKLAGFSLALAFIALGLSGFFRHKRA